MAFLVALFHFCCVEYGSEDIFLFKHKLTDPNYGYML